MAAVAAAYGSLRLRRRAGQKLHVRDPLVGAAEDALVAGSGLGLLKLPDPRR